MIFNIQDQWQLWSLGRSLSYSRCRKLSKIIPNMIPEWSKNDQEIIPKWSRSHPKIIPNSSRHDPKDIPKWFQSHLPKLYKSHLKIVSKSSKSDAKHTSSHWFFIDFWINYSLIVIDCSSIFQWFTFGMQNASRNGPREQEGGPNINWTFIDFLIRFWRRFASRRGGEWSKESKMLGPWIRHRARRDGVPGPIVYCCRIFFFSFS